VQVFDDGIRTYFRVPSGMAELPALFSVKEQDAALVNYAVKDGYLIAQGVGGVFLLKLGKQEAKVEKDGKKNFFSSLTNGR
jgi:type IV secretory pathway VirB9-like protein